MFGAMVNFLLQRLIFHIFVVDCWCIFGAMVDFLLQRLIFDIFVVYSWCIFAAMVDFLIIRGTLVLIFYICSKILVCKNSMINLLEFY